MSRFVKSRYPALNGLPVGDYRKKFSQATREANRIAGLTHDGRKRRRGPWHRYPELDSLPPRKRAVERVKRWSQRMRAAGLNSRGKPYGVPGRKGYPFEYVIECYACYLLLRSLSKVARIYGVTRQSIYEMFATRGLWFFPRSFKSIVEYNGRKYTPGKNGYLRDTIFRRGRKQGEALLHRRVWEQHHGPIPAGYQVGFRDHNKMNCSIRNLICLPHGRMSSRNATGENGATKTARERLALMLKGSRTAKLLEAA